MTPALLTLAGCEIQFLYFLERNGDVQAVPRFPGLDPAQDEAASRRAEKVGKLPGKPTPEAVKTIEWILKKKAQEQQ